MKKTWIFLFVVLSFPFALTALASKSYISLEEIKLRYSEVPVFAVWAIPNNNLFSSILLTAEGKPLFYGAGSVSFRLLTERPAYRSQIVPRENFVHPTPTIPPNDTDPPSTPTPMPTPTSTPMPMPTPMPIPTPIPTPTPIVAVLPSFESPSSVLDAELFAVGRNAYGNLAFSNGQIFIADITGHNIAVYEGGILVDSWSTGKKQVYAVSVDPESGLVYVSVKNEGTHIFTRDGTFIAIWNPAPGNAIGYAFAEDHISVAFEDGTVIVYDKTTRLETTRIIAPIGTLELRGYTEDASGNRYFLGMPKGNRTSILFITDESGILLDTLDTNIRRGVGLAFDDNGNLLILSDFGNQKGAMYRLLRVK